MYSSASIDLPAELISQICDILYHSHPPSLLNFARCNKASYAIAAAFLCRTIWVFVTGSEDLTTHVQEHLHRLHRLGTSRSVHRLVIYGPGMDYPPLDTVEIIAKHPVLTHTPMYDLENRFNNPRQCPYPFDGSPVARVYEADDGWLPLANLIQQLPTLKDLIYQCPVQFPPCLLQTLHQHQPRCRLHIDNFFLRSLAIMPPTEDPYEFMLATSPCLYSINITGDYSNRTARSHHAGAVFRLVAGLAPNLKEVHQFRTAHQRWTGPEEHADFISLWSYLPIYQKFARTLGSLSCLQLWGGITKPAFVPRQVIDDWNTHTDFTVLRTLRINNILTRDALKYLVNVSDKFQSLETLALVLDRTWVSNIPNIRLVQELVHGLRGLHTLEVIGCPGSLDLCTNLNFNMRDLTLDTCLSIREIADIRERCPFLKSLKLSSLHTKEDTIEIDMYSELGTLPKLENLTLETCAVSSHRYADALIHSPVDGTRAQVIFETISRVKQRHNLVPLKKLRIENKQHTNFYPSLNLGRNGIRLLSTWQVERSPRDDSPEMLLIRRLD